MPRVSGTDGASWEVCFNPDTRGGDALRPLAALLLTLARREASEDPKNDTGQR
jgi:hypothetical protein